MRITCLLLALLFSPALVQAQQGPPERRHAPERPQQLPAQPPPSALGPIGLPLPSIGLPLPPLGLQPVPGQNPMPDHPVYAPNHRGHSRPPGGYVMPGYGYFWTGGYATAEAAPPPLAPAVSVYSPQTGTLRLDVNPAGQWQLFVDNMFIGEADDLGNEVNLPIGARRIEIRAPGYQPLIFGARIETQRTITYRGSLDPIASAARPSAPAVGESPAATPKPAVPQGSRTMYLIPGCYVGNIVPLPEKLRDGCDLGTMKTITP